MEYRNLITLKTIIEEGSFQAAAKKLNYNQSTITFQVHQLEEELGIKVFEKVGRTMRLSRAGSNLVPLVDEALACVKRIREYAQSQQDLCGSLNIAATEALLSYKMQDVLSEFKKQAPNAKINIEMVPCYQMESRILEGDLDLGVGYVFTPDHPLLVQQRLEQYPLVLVASPLLKEEDADFIRECQNKENLSTIFPNAGINRMMFEDYLKKKSIHMGNCIELGSVESIKKSVGSNLGVSYLPYFCVKEELKCGKLIELQTELSPSYLTGQYILYKNKWCSAEMKLMMELLEMHL